jgi:O-succinylbenzoic acid--CoA ligase
MITFGTSSYSLEKIKSGDKGPLSSFYSKAFDFCSEWLNGRSDFVLQTSGSTGVPKLVEVSRLQLTESARATRNFFGLTDGCKMLCCLDTEKVAGKMMLVRAMEWKADVRVIPPGSNPFNGLKFEFYDFVALVPLQVEKSLSSTEGKKMLAKFRNIIIGGAPVSSFLRDKIKGLPGKIFQTYGMTETVSHIALANLKAKGPLLYHTLPGVRLRVDKKNRLLIHAPMGGDKWLLTNDVVNLQSEKTFYWKGRADNIVNSGGIKLHPEEIANELVELTNTYFPGSLFFLIGVKDDSLGQALAMVIEGENQPDVSKQFITEAKRFLPKYHCPKKIVFVPKFAVTPSGKIDQLRTLAK